MPLTAATIMAALNNGLPGYDCFVPKDDNEFSYTPGEQAVTTSNMYELVAGYGIHELGPAEDELHKLVYIMKHKNDTWRESKMPYVFAPFFVVERNLFKSLLEEDKTDNNAWLEYAADDKEFFNAAKDYAAKNGDTVFIFVLLSKPNTRRHSYVCLVRVDAERSFAPIGDDAPSFMVIFDATGDEHKSTEQSKYIIPWLDNQLCNGERPKARHSPKIFKDDKAKGTSCNVQLALQTIKWSTNGCLAYVYCLIARLLNFTDDNVRLFGSEHALYADFHNWFTDVLTLRVKYVTTRLLRMLTPLRLEPNKTLYAVVVNHENVDIKRKPLSLQQVTLFKHSSNSKIVLRTTNAKPKSTTRWLCDEYETKFAHKAVYILGFGEVGIANLKILNDCSRIADGKSAQTQFWNLLSEIEDRPGVLVVVKEGKVVEGEGTERAFVELQPNGTFPADVKVSVDHELFRTAHSADIPCKIVAYNAKADSYRVILSTLLDHPLFVLDVASDQLEQNFINEFWATLEVPASMRVPWTFTPPVVFPQQQKGDFGCIWRGIAALLGHPEALCFVWLQKIDRMLNWRMMGKKGCKYNNPNKPNKPNNPNNANNPILTLIILGRSPTRI
jgi:hypothetical protein